MRQGRKSRSQLVDGYKRYVLRDLDSGLVPAVGITLANVPEAKVTGSISLDLHAQALTLRELHIDRAYTGTPLNPSNLLRDLRQLTEWYTPALLVVLPERVEPMGGLEPPTGCLRITRRALAEIV